MAAEPSERAAELQANDARQSQDRLRPAATDSIERRVDKDGRGGKLELV